METLPSVLKQEEPTPHMRPIVFATYGSIHIFLILHIYTFCKTGRIVSTFNNELVQICTIPIIMFGSLLTDRLYHRSSFLKSKHSQITPDSKIFLIVLIFSSTFFMFLCMSIEIAIQGNVNGAFSIYSITLCIAVLLDLFYVKKIWHSINQISPAV